MKLFLNFQTHALSEIKTLLNMFHRMIGKQDDFYMIIDDEQIIFQNNLNCDSNTLMMVQLVLPNNEVLEKNSQIHSKFENNRIVLNINGIKDFIGQFKNAQYDRDQFKMTLKALDNKQKVISIVQSKNYEGEQKCYNKTEQINVTSLNQNYQEEEQIHQFDQQLRIYLNNKQMDTMVSMVDTMKSDLDLTIEITENSQLNLTSIAGFHYDCIQTVDHNLEYQILGDNHGYMFREEPGNLFKFQIDKDQFDEFYKLNQDFPQALEQTNWNMVYDDNRKGLIVETDSVIGGVQLSYQFNIFVPIKEPI